MSSGLQYNVVVTVDPVLWSRRKEGDILADWVEPLCAHPQINEVVFAGTVKPFADLPKNPKLRFVSRRNSDRELIQEYGSKAGIEGVLRLNHLGKLRFPILASLLSATFATYEKQARGGFFQMDLSDLPYPYLMPEVLGKSALQYFAKHKTAPLDWNNAKACHDSELLIVRGTAPYDCRVEYLDNPNVEYYGFPKFIALESSRLCNLRCTMCVTHSDFIDHSHLEKYPKHFDLDKYKSILDEMAPYAEQVSIAPQFQGEPFMAPHILEMIAYAHKKAFSVGFTSNATLWSEEIIDFLIDQEVNNLCVSLDGATKDTYERVRIGANFDTVVKNLNYLVQRKLERGVVLPSLSINMTLMPENRHQQEKMLQDWLGKANVVSINNTCINHVVPEKFHEPERYPCPFLWEGVHILTNGDVIACCRDSDYEEVMGNAYDTPLLEVWNGEKYRHFRKLHSLKRWNEIPICARCDTWMCKTKKTVGEGDRMVMQYPFYRQYLPMRSEYNPPASQILEEIWGAVKSSAMSATTTLINLTPLRSKSS